MGDAIMKSSSLAKKLAGPQLEEFALNVESKLGNPAKSVTTTSSKQEVQSLQSRQRASEERTRIARRSLLR
jgi:hypothetical protein